MADLSAIGALSSLSEKDLYYQYLINNNSASTMFKALAGNSTQDSGDGLGLSGLMGVVSQAGSLSGFSSCASWAEVPFQHGKGEDSLSHWMG